MQSKIKVPGTRKGQRMDEWHRWYAWRPVKATLFEDFTPDHEPLYRWVWLTYVERKVEIYWGGMDYDTERSYRVTEETK